jgi:hypothetical protein
MKLSFERGSLLFTAELDQNQTSNRKGYVFVYLYFRREACWNSSQNNIVSFGRCLFFEQLRFNIIRGSKHLYAGHVARLE